VIIEQSEACEGPAIEWLFREAQRLAQALRAAEVAPDVARTVCESFVFGMASALDHTPVESDGSSWTATVAFLGDGPVLAPDPTTFAWHDYALGVVGEVFGDE
jgi:hypothetical protein